MALEMVVELGEDTQIGFEAESERIMVLHNDEVVETFRESDSISPPCCLLCLETGNWVEVDGSCEHGKQAYTRKVGLV